MKTLSQKVTVQELLLGGDEGGCVSLSQTDKRLTEIECKNISLSKDMTKQELESSAYNLRIQGVMQQKDEDIYETAIECLAPLANFSKEEMSREIDQVYRLHTAVTRRMNKLPELIVRFCRRCIKDRVLKATLGHQLDYQGTPITILKDTPWKIRQLRRQYQKINNVAKVKKFVHKYAEKLKYQTTSASDSETSDKDKEEEVIGAAVGTRSGKNQKKKAVQKKQNKK